MRIIERENLSVELWDELVSGTEGSTFFSYSWYLDAVAENWYVVVDDKYTTGMALPFTVRLGMKTLYTPIYIRYIEWFGKEELQSEAVKLIYENFKNINLALSTPLFGESFSKRVFQRISIAEPRSIGSQAKRMLGKANKNCYQVQSSYDYSSIEEIIENELIGNIKGMNSKSFPALRRLFLNAKDAGVLKVYTVGEQGGIVCLFKEGYALYLKGTVSDEVKKNGGMYLVMNTFIEESLSKNQNVDFGGSNIPGVARFNHNLDGKDHEYFSYTIGKVPFWFKFAKSIKKAWKK